MNESVKFPWIEVLRKNVKKHPFYHLKLSGIQNLQEISETVSLLLLSSYRVDISERHPAQKKWGYNGVCGFMSREGWKIFPELTSFIMDIYIYMKTINTWQFWKRAMFGGMMN